MAKYLDNDGVLYFWNKLKSYFVKQESGKGLSTNDFTSTLKSKLDGIATGANKYVHPTYTSRASGLYKITVDATGHISQVASVVKSDITGLGIPGQDTTYSNMTGATSSVAGKAGLVPPPASGKQSAFLRGDGEWANPPNTTYGVVTTTTNGLMLATDKVKLNGIATGANKTVVDSSISATSTNPVQNKVIHAYLEDMEDGLIAQMGSVLPEYPTTGKLTPYILQLQVDDLYGALNYDLFFGQPDIATGNHDGFMSSEMAAKLSQFQNASAYALKTDIVGMYKYKGSVANSSNLPTSNQVTGDVYNIVNVSSYGPAGTNVAWDGSKWDALGGLFEIESITNAELDSICV